MNIYCVVGRTFDIVRFRPSGLSSTRLIRVGQVARLDMHAQPEEWRAGYSVWPGLVRRTSMIARVEPCRRWVAWLGHMASTYMLPGRQSSWMNLLGKRLWVTSYRVWGWHGFISDVIRGPKYNLCVKRYTINPRKVPCFWCPKYCVLSTSLSWDRL